MVKAKRSFSKKEIREDKLITSYYKTIDFYEGNKSVIQIVAAALLVIVVGAVIYGNSRLQANEEANTQLGRMMPVYDQGNYLEAIEGRPGTPMIGLAAIVEEYGSTSYGEVAKIYLGNAYYFLGRYEEALAAYEDYSGDNDLMQSAAYAGIAAYYEAVNNAEEAADYYQRAAEVSSANALNPKYLINASVNLLEIGEKEEAKKLLESIKRDYKQTVYSREVDRYLQQAG